MMSTLTKSDHAFVDGLRAALRCELQWYLSQRGFSVPEQDPGDVTIPWPSHLPPTIPKYDKAYSPCSELAEFLRRHTRGNGLVAEAWEYEYAENVTEAAAELPEYAGEALLRYTGYRDVDLHEMADDAEEAVAEARQLLYGE